MLRSIKLSVDQPYIDPTSPLKHSGTSYQVSTTPDFTVVGNLVVNKINDIVNLLSHTFQYNIQPNQSLYVRTRYHFNNNTLSSWSNIVDINNNQVGFKSSSSIVSTPLITAKVDYTNSEIGELVITLANTVMYTGAGKIVSTSWNVETTDGTNLYSLPNCVDKINQINLPISMFSNITSLVCTAQIHSDVNVDSNVVSTFVNLNKTITSYFLATIKSSLYMGSTNSITVAGQVKQYQSTDVRILLPDGSVVSEITGLDPHTPTFKLGALDSLTAYTVELRAHSSTGSPTPWITVYKGYASIRSIREYNTSVVYDKTKMGFATYFNFEGLSAQTVQADEDNVFYLAIPNTTTLAAYKSTAGALYPTGKVLDLGVNNLFKIPNINYMHLHNGQVVIDHNLAISGGNIEVASFSVYDYDRLTKQLTYVKQLVRPDERYGTGRCGSAAVMVNDSIYYIPSEIFGANNAQLGLELRVYDPISNAITANIPLPLPAGVRQNVALTADMNGDIYIYGGSDTPAKRASNGEMFANLLNQTVYKLNKIDNSWITIGTIPVTASNSYRFKLLPLKDGNLLCLNVTPTQIGGLNYSSIFFSPTKGTVTGTVINNPSRERLGISFELRNGDIGVMSSTADVSESVSYVKTTISDAVTSTALLVNSNRVPNLVIPFGKTVYIRDAYLYDSITIQGTSLANTGCLAIIKGGVVNKYYYNDLIITRPMTITIPAGGVGPTYNTILHVGDATLNIVQL